MRTIKLSLCAGVAALAVLCFAGSPVASAATLCKVQEPTCAPINTYPVGTQFQAQLGSEPLSFISSVGKILCGKSSLTITVEKAGFSVQPSTSQCTQQGTTMQFTTSWNPSALKLTLKPNGSGNGTAEISSSSGELFYWNIESGSARCSYGAKTLTPGFVGGSSPSILMVGQSGWVGASGNFCGAGGSKMSAHWLISSAAPVWMEN